MLTALCEIQNLCDDLCMILSIEGLEQLIVLKLKLKSFNSNHEYYSVSLGEKPRNIRCLREVFPQLCEEN